MKTYSVQLYNFHTDWKFLFDKNKSTRFNKAIKNGNFFFNLINTVLLI